MKMIFQALLSIIIVTLSVFIIFSFLKTWVSPVSKQVSFGTVCFKEKCFKVELAKTQAETERGLMNRKELDKDKGMLFIFNKEAIYPFWMKNTLIPLDIIWIKEGPSAGSGQVVFVSYNTQPCLQAKSLICPSVVPSAKAKYVLELNAGICQEISLRVGDELKIKYD
jgi:uncharacterized membrane protein (UPF0127 family)